MIGKFITERVETTKQNFFVVVANGGCTMDDLQRCLMSRNINSKRDEKHKKTTEKKSEAHHISQDIPRLTTPVRNSTRKNDDRSEILIEGTALNCQNLTVQNADGAKITPCAQSSLEEQIASSSKDKKSQADEIAMNAERSLINSPELSLNTLTNRSDQDNEVNLSGSPKAVHRSLNPSPWKEIWSVLQDRSLANCLSTKSMEFGRDISETPFSTRTNPYSKQRREKPQRIPPLYNTRKTVPTTHGNKAKIPSFDDAVVFNTVFKDVRRDQGIGGAHDIAKCKECIKITEFKDNSMQIESSGGHTCGKYESKDKKEKTIGLPNITPSRSATDRYKSKFRVRLLPLVAKSDSLPNLASTSTSAPSELIVTAPMNEASSNENVRLDCLKSEDIRNNLVTESELIASKCRQNRSMSLDSVFSVESFAAYHAKKSTSKGINVQGFQVLPDIKQTEPKKYQPALKQTGKEVSGITQTTVNITLPWKCK